MFPKCPVINLLKLRLSTSVILVMVTPGVTETESPALCSLKHARIVATGGTLEVTQSKLQPELGFFL